MVGQYALLEKCVLCALHVFIGIFKVFRNQLGSLGIFSAAGSWSMVKVFECSFDSIADRCALSALHLAC